MLDDAASGVWGWVMRRRFMGVILRHAVWRHAALALCLMAVPALAQSYEASIIAQLRKQGYVEITQTKTLLGRIKILARQNGGWREIVINPRTGEVLRDVWTVGGKAASPRIGDPAGKGGPVGANAGHSGSGDSGTGSGGSGSGADNGGSDDGHDGEDSGGDSPDGDGGDDGGGDDDGSGDGGDDHGGDDD